MSNESAKVHYCEMQMLLDKYVDGSSTYEVEAGLERNFFLYGSVDDLDYGFMGDGPGLPRGAFHGKNLRIEIRTPVDGEFLRLISAKHLGASERIGVDDASSLNIENFCHPNPCGLAFVLKDVSPEQFELYGEQLERDPIEITLSLPMDAFEGIRRQATEAYERRRVLSATMRLVGNALPPKGKGIPGLGLELNELDISKNQSYAIQSFKISGTRLFVFDRGRVEYIRPEKGKDYGVDLSIMLSSVRYELAIEQPVDRWPVDTSISCLGRITNAHGAPYQGAEVEVKFLEHETNRFGELPRQGYFGTFEYFPKDPEPNGLNARLYFYLAYIPSDARTLIHDLVGQGPNSNVVLSILLAVERSAFDGTKKVDGNVRRYGFHVSQSLVATDLEKSASKADIERLGKAVGELQYLMESVRTENEKKYPPDRTATKGDIQLLHDSIKQSNVSPVVTKLIEKLQYMSSRITRIWWLLIGGLAASIALQLTYASPWQ